jgi:cellulose synthase operon protein C
VFLCLNFAWSARADDPKQAEGYLEEVTKSLQKGDISTAIIHLKNAVKADPKNGEPRFDLAVAQFLQGDFRSADAQLHAAIDRGFDRDKIAPLLAEILLRLDQNKKLLDEISTGERPPRIEASVRTARGYALLNLRRLSEAKLSFEQSLALFPAAATQMGLARVFAASGDLPDAIAALQKAMDDNPKSLNGWVFLGQIRRAQGDHVAARASFNKAVELAPKNSIALLERASLLIETDELALADADIDAVLKANPEDAFATYLKALAYSKKQNFRAAEASLLKMKGGLNNFPPAIYLLATVNMAQGQLGQAEANINRFLSRAPNDEAGTAILVTLLAHRNNLPKAIEVLRAAVEANPKSLVLLGYLNDAYVRNKQPEKAAAILDRAAIVAPDNADLMARLAVQRLRIGRSEAALNDLEAASKLAPKSPQIASLLILTYLQANKNDDALKAAMAMHERIPEDPVSENFIGAIGLRKGDHLVAKAHFENALKIKSDFIPAQMNLGQLAIAEREFTKARGISDGILARNAQNTAALAAEADISLAEDKIDDAVRWLEKARDSDPIALGARLRLVEIYLGRAELRKAAGVASELAHFAPDDPRAVNAVFETRLANKEGEAAVDSADRLATLIPTSARAQLQRARAFHAVGRTELARNAIERAAVLGADDTVIQGAFLNFVAETNSIDQEIQFLKARAAERPDDPGLDLLAGNLAMAADRARDAEEMFAKGLAKRADSPVLVMKLSQAQAAISQDTAVGTLSTWLEKYPDAAAIRLTLGNRLLAMKRYDEAANAYQTVIKSQPDNVVAGNNLAWLYQKTGDARALSVAEAVHSSNPNDVKASDTLAWILVRGGQSERGLELLERITTSPTASLEARYHLVVALKGVGRTADARRQLETLLSADMPFESIEDAKTLMHELPGG